MNIESVIIYPNFSAGHVVSFEYVNGKWMVENYVDKGIYYKRMYTDDLDESVQLHMKEFLPSLINNCVPDDIDKSKLNSYYHIANYAIVKNIINNYYGMNVTQKFIINKLKIGGDIK